MAINININIIIKILISENYINKVNIIKRSWPNSFHLILKKLIYLEKMP